MGRVYYGIARYGKVRGKTPQVPKQEKKTPQTGRAKKKKAIQQAV